MFSGELFFIGYQMDKKPPCVWYAGLDKEGELQFDVRVDLKEGVMMHDMAITQARLLKTLGFLPFPNKYTLLMLKYTMVMEVAGLTKFVIPCRTMPFFWMCPLCSGQRYSVPLTSLHST